MTMRNLQYTNLTWDILRGLRAGRAGGYRGMGAGRQQRQSRTVPADLIAAAKASPGTINYGSGGSGSPQHIAMALFASTAGIQLTHVPYKGATQAALGVAAGEVAVAFQGLATVTGLVKGGKVRLIGVTTRNRLSQFAEAPTVGESGLPGFEFTWFAGDGTGRHAEGDRRAPQQRNARALADAEIRKARRTGTDCARDVGRRAGTATRAQLALIRSYSARRASREWEVQFSAGTRRP
jgi:hypothetical protein